MSTHARHIISLIDHTILKADVTPAQVEIACQEARQYGFAAVCVNGMYIPQAATALRGSPVGLSVNVGFPLGANATAVKVLEASLALDQGATEADMVLKVGALKTGQYRDVHHDVAAVAAACHERGAILKVILENALLTDEEKRIACDICTSAYADFVKTSTGLSTGGATVDDVRLMRASVPERVQVKAAGGIRTLAEARAMAAAGATRIGTTAGVSIAQAALGEDRTPLVEGGY